MVSALILIFVGCANSSDKTTSTPMATSAKVVKFENKDIETIELMDKKTNKTQKLNSTADIQTIVDGLEKATEKIKLSLDKDALDHMTAVMKMVYKDDTKQEYFVWTAEGEKVMFVKSTTDNHTVGYGVNGAVAKSILQLITKK